MTEGNLEKKEIRGTKRLRKLLWPAAIVLAIIIVVLVFFRRNSRELLTIDEKLAVIETAPAIPEQNIAQLPGQKVEGAKMIFDRIESAHLYTNLNDRFTKAFEILADKTLSSKQDGRYAVEGNDLYYIVQHYTTKPMEKDKLEAHRKYIDIQAVLSGEELLAYAPIEGLAVAQPYSEDKDIAFYHAPDKISMVTLRPGVFCILFPQDGHIPCCQLDGPSGVHKVVVKVGID